MIILLLATEHSLCTAPGSGTPCRITFAQRTMSPLDRASFRQGLKTWIFSRYYRVQRIRDFVTMRNTNSHLPYHTIPYHLAWRNKGQSNSLPQPQCHNLEAHFRSTPFFGASCISSVTLR